MFRSLLYRILLTSALIALMLGAGGATAQERSEPDLTVFDRYIEKQMGANRVPDLALAITRGDEILYLQRYDTAGDGERVTPRTQFYTTSLGKSFTIFAII